MPAVLAIAAHPDDIEFRMAGTMALLRQRGWDLHCLNIANGCLGSMRIPAATLKRLRAAEARQAAKILGARWHPSLCNDMEIVYDLKLLRRVAAVVRQVKPAIVLTHPPVDYMEDHTNACRLAVSAAFTREMPNYKTNPPRRPCPGPVVVYHCVPHGLCDPLRRPMMPDLFVDTSSVHAIKQRALAAHASQRNWLESSQGFDSMQQSLDDASRAVGRMSRKFPHAEGWWRHLHYGYAGETDDPVSETLGSSLVAHRRTRRG